MICLLPRQRTKPSIRLLKPLAQIDIESVLAGRRDDAIEEYNINITGLNRREVNKLIRERHKSKSCQYLNFKFKCLLFI